MDEAVLLRLVYVGRRWSGRTLGYGWVLPDKPDDERLFSKLKGSAIGGYYTVQGSPDAERVYPNSLRYDQDRFDEDARVALWQAQDADVRAEKERQAAERRHTASGPLEEALAPVLALAEQCRTRQDSVALSHVVSQRILEAYWRSHG